MDDPSLRPPLQDDTERRLADSRRRAARERGRLEAEIDRLEAFVADRSDRLARARAEIERLRTDPAVARLLAARSRVHQLVRRFRRATSIVAARLPGSRSAPLAEREAAEAWLQRLPRAEVATRIVAAHGPAPSPPSPCPLVSIILSVPGETAPGPVWVDALATTAWPALEWLVATDLADRQANAIAERLSEGAGRRAQVVVGATAAGALRDALERASGVHVAFLQAGVMPADPDWLVRLLAGAEAVGATAASPRLLGFEDPGPASPGAGATSIRLAGRGVAFRPGPGLPLPEPLGHGEDPFGPEAGATALRAVPGQTGLVVRLDALDGLDLPPIDEIAEFAVELGLRLRERGDRVAYVGCSVLWHRDEPSAASGESGTTWTELHARWGPRLHREVWRDALRGPGEWASRPLRAAIAGGEDTPGLLRTEIAEGLREHGWWVVESGAEPDVEPDVLVILDPATDLGRTSRHVVRIAWIAAGTEAAVEWAAGPWFDDLDLVASGSSEAVPASIRGRAVARVGGPADLHAAVAGWVERIHVAIHIGPANWAAAERWGDTPFARAVARQLEALGNPSTVVVYSECDDAVALRADVALHIVGTRRLPLRPAQLNLLWIISHPDAVRAERCAAYDLVFVASDPFLEDLAEQVSVPLIQLHQATDPDLFWPEPGGPAHELLFVGNSRNRHRPVLDALAGTDRDLAVYGGNWRPDLLDPRYLRSDWIPNDQVHRAYASAAIVLNDHWSDMRDEGFISNRIYDVLASGGFVLTDPVAGLDLEFDGAVATWTNAADLRASVERYLAEPELRRAMSERGREAVLARHTFAHRAEALVAAARPLWERRPAGIAGPAEMAEERAPADP